MTPTLTTTVTELSSGGYQIEVCLRNTSDDPFTFSTLSAQVFDVQVETPDGEAVWSPSVGYTQASERWSLDPGEEMTRTYRWRTPSERMTQYEGQPYDYDVSKEDFPDPTAYDTLRVRARLCGSAENVTCLEDCP